jgi:hypothetical protein
MLRSALKDGMDRDGKDAFIKHGHSDSQRGLAVPINMSMYRLSTWVVSTA